MAVQKFETYIFNSDMLMTINQSSDYFLEFNRGQRFSLTTFAIRAQNKDSVQPHIWLLGTDISKKF